MLPDSGQSEKPQVPAEIAQPAMERIDEFFGAVDELAANQTVLAGQSEVIKLQQAAPVETTQPADFSQRNMTADEARQAIERWAA